MRIEHEIRFKRSRKGIAVIHHRKTAESPEEAGGRQKRKLKGKREKAKGGRWKGEGIGWESGWGESGYNLFF